MGSIDVGGDSSVTWKVDVGRVRKAKVNPGDVAPPVSKPVGSHGHHQEGIDETDAGNQFTVVLQLPTGPVTHNIPIQPSTPNQIHIEWPSSTSIATTSASMGAWKPSAKKSGKKKARKAKAKKKK
jgi:hypothetical protein